MEKGEGVIYNQGAAAEQQEPVPPSRRCISLLWFTYLSDFYSNRLDICIDKHNIYIHRNNIHFLCQFCIPSLRSLSTSNFVWRNHSHAMLLIQFIDHSPSHQNLKNNLKFIFESKIVNKTERFNRSASWQMYVVPRRIKFLWLVWFVILWGAHNTDLFYYWVQFVSFFQKCLCSFCYWICSFHNLQQKDGPD